MHWGHPPLTMLPHKEDLEDLDKIEDLDNLDDPQELLISCAVPQIGVCSTTQDITSDQRPVSSIPEQSSASCYSSA